MAQKYADRAFISINGTRLADVKSSSLRQNFNAREVPTMTTDGFNRGFVQGNRTIDIQVQIAVLNRLARPKLESIDYENNDVQLTYEVGADQFVATGLFPKEVGDDASGVGQEANASFSFGALRLIDGAGNSVLFDIDL